MSGLHAREYAPDELNTRFAEYLVANYNVNPDVTWLLDYNEIHLLLQANPDGRKKAESGLSWRKNTDNLYCSNTNSRGVDLNRNFSFNWGCFNGSSTNPCDEVYRGPVASSEPETQAVQNYLRAHFPDQRQAVMAIVVAICSNAVVKASIVFVAGGRSLGMRCVTGFGAMVAALLAGAGLTLL